ncbi:MAG: hypothetical protein ACYC7H_00315 [Chloroflexota bacterium]
MNESGPADLPLIYERLLAQHGPQHWWPARTAFEVTVGAILTQSCAWTNVARAIANLQRAGVLSPAAIHALPEKELGELIRPSGYFNAKARKVKAFVAVLMDEFGGELPRLLALPTALLREELLAIYGVGPETADSIALYAGDHPLFVVDAYTRRIFTRLGLVNAKATYGEVQAFFMDNLPPDVPLFNEYHALIVAHGKDVCQKRPKCGECAIAKMCLACGTSD